MSDELPGCSCFVVSWHGVAPHRARWATKTPLKESNLSVRARKIAIRLGVAYMEDLSRFTKSEILAVKNAGYSTASEIERELSKKALSFVSEATP